MAAGGFCRGRRGAPCDWRGGYVDHCANLSRTRPFLKPGSIYSHCLRLNDGNRTGSRLLMTFTKRSSVYDDDGFGSGSRGLVSYDEGDS